MRVFLRRIGDGLLPEQFSVATRETDQRAKVVLFDGLRHKNFVAPDGGGGIATVRQRGFPTDVLGRASAGRQVLFRRDAGTFRAAPGGPVSCQQGSGKKQNGEMSQGVPDAQRGWVS